MNSIILTGNMTRDPELRYSPSGVAVTKFTLAVNHGWGDKKETYFINVTTFNKTAEAVANYSAKGKKMLVRGYLQVKVSDAADGTKKYYTEVIAEECEFLSPWDKKEDEPAGQTAQVPGVPDDDLPF